MGMQVMAQYNNDNKNVKVEGHQELDKKYVHNIKINKNSILFNIIQKDNIMVNSMHSYAISNSGEYNVVARCSSVIEAIEMENELFNIGVQWHPEKNLDDVNSVKLFSAFIQACKVYKKLN